MEQSREAHHPARPLHSPEGANSPDTPRPSIMRPAQHRAIPHTPRSKLLLSRLLARWWRADLSHPIPLRMWSAATASDGDPLAFRWSAPVWSPAGIEPATPSLPSMRPAFTSPCDTSRDHTTAQVKGEAEDRAVGRREGTCGAVSGKSLARPVVVFFCNRSGVGVLTERRPTLDAGEPSLIKAKLEAVAVEAGQQLQALPRLRSGHGRIGAGVVKAEAMSVAPGVPPGTDADQHREQPLHLGEGLTGGAAERAMSSDAVTAMIPRVRPQSPSRAHQPA
jgi:hypothetical protein